MTTLREALGRFLYKTRQNAFNHGVYSPGWPQRLPMVALKYPNVRKGYFAYEGLSNATLLGTPLALAAATPWFAEQTGIKLPPPEYVVYAARKAGEVSRNLSASLSEALGSVGEPLIKSSSMRSRLAGAARSRGLRDFGYAAGELRRQLFGPDRKVYWGAMGLGLTPLAASVGGAFATGTQDEALSNLKAQGAHLVQRVHDFTEDPSELWGLAKFPGDPTSAANRAMADLGDVIGRDVLAPTVSGAQRLMNWMQQNEAP